MCFMPRRNSGRLMRCALCVITRKCQSSRAMALATPIPFMACAVVAVDALPHQGCVRRTLLTSCRMCCGLRLTVGQGMHPGFKDRLNFKADKISLEGANDNLRWLEQAEGHQKPFKAFTDNMLILWTRRPCLTWSFRWARVP